MAIFNRLTDKLRSPIGSVVEVRDGDEYETARKKAALRLYNYLTGDEDELKQYMSDAMGGVFKPETISRMPLPYLNIFRRIIERLAVVYQEPAERYLLAGENPTKENPSNDAYQLLLEGSNINAASKAWNRYAKAFDTAYVAPAFRTDHLEYDVFAPHQLTVTPRQDDFLTPARLEYTQVSGDYEERVIWTDEAHWIVNADGVPIAGRNPWNGVNRYGLIPFVPLRLRDIEDHWGDGDEQLADVNEKINVLLASTYYNCIMQTHSQLVTVNFGLKDGAQLRLGPDSVMNIENVLEGEVMPKAEYIKPDPAIDSALKMIDWMVKTAAMMRGLPASSVSLETVAQSGAAKSIDNQELYELRADDIERLRPFEKRLFKTSATVWNFHRPEKIAVDAVQFAVDFEMPDASMSALDEATVQDKDFALGLWTPVDELTDEDEGISRDDAKRIWLDNLALKAEYMGIVGNANAGQAQFRLRADGSGATDNTQGRASGGSDTSGGGA